MTGSKRCDVAAVAIEQPADAQHRADAGERASRPSRIDRVAEQAAALDCERGRRALQALGSGSAIQAMLPCSSSVQVCISPRRRLRGRARPGTARAPARARRRGRASAAGRSGAQRSTYAPFGIEPLLLQQRVEDAEVGRRIEPGSGDPLPAARVRRQVAVDEVRAIPALAAPPVDVQVLAEEARADHADAVRLVACLGELAHAGVDECRNPSRRGTTPRTRRRRPATGPLVARVDRTARRGPGGGAART